MKKNFFLWVAVFAVGAMSSCSVDKVVDQAEARYIGFDPFANKVTRAATTTAEGLGHSSFSVFGRYEEGTSTYNVIFNNKEVKWTGSTLDDTGGSWKYEPLVPWVSSKDYEFAAIAPYSASYENAYDYTNDTYTLGSITLNAAMSEEKYTNQIDYMTATTVNRNSGTSTAAVSFTFNHIASKIDFNFQPKTADPNAWLSPVKIDIKKITLANVNTVNTYNANNWSTSTTPVDFVKGDGSTIYGTTTYNGSKAEALVGEFSWLVVPQIDTEASNRALTIKFDVSTQDATGAYTVKVLTDKEATVDIDTNWAANTVYTYTVYIGSDVLGPNAYITFDVASADWGKPSSDNDLNVPTN